MSKIERLVAYGCSFTQGGELQDEEWLPGAEEIKRKHGLDAFFRALDKKLPNEEQWNIYYDSSKKFSYANILAEKLGLACLNQSRPGNSMMQILWQIETDLANGTIGGSDLVIVGITSCDRIAKITEFREKIRCENLHMAWPVSWPEDLRPSHPHLVKWFTLETAKFLQAIFLSHLLGLAKSVLSDRLYFVECYPLHGPEGKEDKHCEEYKLIVSRIFTELQNSGLLLSDNHFFYKVFDNDLLGGGHPKLHVHQRWAEEIYNNCRHKGLTQRCE